MFSKRVVLIVLLGLFSSTVFCPASPQGSAASDEPTRNLAFEQISTTYRYRNSGMGEVVQSARIRVLTEAGLKMLSQVYFPYSSQLESLRIDYVRTIKPDGAILSADPSRAFDLTPPITRFAPTFSDVKLKGLVPPQLAVGDAVEYQFTKTVRVPMKPGDFWVMHFLARVFPLQSETVVLDVPAGRRLTFKADPCFSYTVNEKDGRKVYRWQVKDLKPFTPGDPPPPPLFAASTLSNWTQVGDWYASLQKGRTQVTPEIEALAKKLTAGKTTSEQKAAAIYAYVSEKIRYVAIEFGIGGYQAHPSSSVLSDGYGDCKDKSGLLTALLAAVGIKAYPVLVNSQRGVIEPDVPMPSQFDHVMTVVLLDGKMIWLDATLEVAPPGVLAVPVRGKQALLVQPGRSRLVQTPDQPPFPEELASNVSGGLDSTGKLTLNARLQARGIAGTIFRGLFRQQDPKALSKFVKRLAQEEVQGATASTPSSSNPDDLSGPFKFQYVLTKTDFFDLLNKSEEVPIPHFALPLNPWQSELKQAGKETASEEKGKAKSGCAAHPAADINLHGPDQYQETMDLTISPGFQVNLPASVQLDRPFASYISSYTFVKGRLHVQRALNVKVAKIPLTEIQDLTNFQSVVNDDLGQKLTLRRTGNTDILSAAASMTADELNSAGMKALNKERNPVLAQELLLKAVAKDPHHKWAWNNLGRSYTATRDFYEAEKAYKKQIEINPYDPWAYNNLGLAEMAQQHYDLAIQDFKHQLAVNPLDRYANASLAAAYDAKQDWNNAAQAYAQAAKIMPGNVLLKVAWGQALLKAGDRSAAQEEFQQALDQNKNPIVLNNIAYALADSGTNLSKAEEDARSAVDEVVPASVDLATPAGRYDAQIATLGTFLDTLGWTLFKEGKVSDAGLDLEGALQIRYRPVIAQHLAMLYMRLDDLQKARRFYVMSVAPSGGPEVHTPPELKDYLTQHGGIPKVTAQDAEDVHRQLDALHRPLSSKVALTWPPQAGNLPAWVYLTALVDENGSVLDANAILGDELFRSAALMDLRQLHFPPLRWANQSIKTVRSVMFIYNPGARIADNRIQVYWRYGKPAEPANSSMRALRDASYASEAAEFLATAGEIPAAVQLLHQAAHKSPDASQTYMAMMMAGLNMKRWGNLDGAAATFHEAARVQPKEGFAYRELATTLGEKGDRKGAIEAYKGLLRLEPDNAQAYYSLGAQFEAEAQNTVEEGAAAGNTPSRTFFQSALEQYHLALKLDPGNKAYRAVCQKLTASLNQPTGPKAQNQNVAPARR